MTAPFEVVDGAHASGPPHLNATQLARLRALLNEQIALQHAALAEQDEALLDATEAVVESAVTTEREVAHAFVQLTRDTTGEIEAALARIDDGTYGTCSSCGTTVPFERLEAIPETRYCINCPRPRSLFR